MSVRVGPHLGPHLGPHVVAGDRLLGSLAELEPLAEAIFGRGQRRPGWLARKLERECVDARSSSLLVEGQLAADERVAVERVVGYAFVGRPASLGTLARGAGVGMLARLRGRSLGTTLLHEACERAAQRGANAIEFLAEPARRAWYARAGFEALRSEWTLQAEATGERDEFEWASPHALERRGACLWSWIVEIWARTPAPERGQIEIAETGLRAWASREARAVLVQRLELGEPGRARAPEQIVAALDHLRTLLPRGTPVLLYPCPAQRLGSLALVEAGWTIAQRSWVMRRGLGR